MPKSLPLPPRFFKCPELSEREELYLVGKAKESAKALVDATRNDEGPVRWQEAGLYRGVQLYKGEARYPERVSGESMTYGCGATTIQSSLNEVADFFDLSTDDKVAKLVEYTGDILDAQLLYVIQDPVLLNDPRYNSRGQRNGASRMLNANQVTVKWVAMDMASKLVKNRDFLTVECQSTFLDASGRRGWVRAYHSIKLPCCPELNEYNLIRGSFYNAGYVFVESERPGFLDVIFSLQMNMKGNVKVPPPLLQKKRLAIIADLQRMITRRRLGSQRFLGDLELVPKSQRTRCHLCSARFGLITRKARCRKCGEVVCASACSTEWEVPIAGQGIRKVRVCSKCAHNSDPSVFQNLPPSEQYSESNSAHDDEVHLMAYNRSEGSSPSRRNRQRGQPSFNSDEGLRHPRRGPRSSLDERFNITTTYHDPDYARTAEMPIITGPTLDCRLNISADVDARRRDDRQNESRRREYLGYDSSPPRYHDEEQRRAWLRQQRAIKQRRPSPIETPDIILDELESDYIEANRPSEAPPILTSSMLARHTMRMENTGRTPSETRWQELEHQVAPTFPSARTRSRLEEFQVDQWKQQEAMFRDMEQAFPPLDFEVESVEFTASFRQDSIHSEVSDGPELPSFFRSSQSSGPSQSYEIEEDTRVDKAEANHSGELTVSVGDDEDPLSTSISGLSIDVDAALRPEDLRLTEEPMRASVDKKEGAVSNAETNAGQVAASAAKTRADASKLTIVKLYQRILEVTNKQQALDAQPESDPNEREEITRELNALYEKLHSEVEI